MPTEEPKPRLGQTTAAPMIGTLPVWHQSLGPIPTMLFWGSGHMVCDCQGREHGEVLVSLGEELNPLAMAVLAKSLSLSCVMWR